MGLLTNSFKVTEHGSMQFLPCNCSLAILSCVFVMSVCLSGLCIVSKMSQHILRVFSPSSRHAILFFCTKACGNILTGLPIMGVSDAIFDQYYTLLRKDTRYGHS